MSAKTELDRKKPTYPWTARQRRQKVSKRLTRKNARKASRNL